MGEEGCGEEDCGEGHDEEEDEEVVEIMPGSAPSRDVDSSPSSSSFWHVVAFMDILEGRARASDSVRTHEKKKRKKKKGGRMSRRSFCSHEEPREELRIR